MSDFVRQKGHNCTFTNNDSWILLSPIEQSIKQKIESVGVPLKDWDIRINYGIKTGYNDAFIVDGMKREEILSNCKTDEERQKTAKIIRPILRGRDIKRYYFEYADLFLIATFPSKHYDIEEYPAIKNHLLSFGKERLEQSGKEFYVNGEKLKARKKTNNKWFETQDSISYWEDFNKPFIAWIELTDESKFTYCENMIALNTVFFLTGEKLFDILGMLNSKLLLFYFKNCLGTTSGVGTNRWLKYTVEQLPLFYNAPKELEGLVKQVITCKIQKKDSSKTDKMIDELIYSLFKLSQKEINYVNGCQTE